MSAIEAVNVQITLRNIYGSGNSGVSGTYITFSSELGSRMKLKIYGDTDFTPNTYGWSPGNEISYPLYVTQNTETMFNRHEWNSTQYDHEAAYASETPTSFDLLIDDKVILSALKSQTATLFLTDFNGKIYTANGYQIVLSIQ